MASPKALQVLATDEAAPCTTACSLEQLLLLEPDSATPELISFFHWLLDSLSLQLPDSALLT